jgi:hypothetical protein
MQLLTRFELSFEPTLDLEYLYIKYYKFKFKFWIRDNIG